jgi:cytidylate kinase
LSREAGANGTLIARAVGERLGWPVYDRELVHHIATDMGVRGTLLDTLDEKHRSWLQECMEAFGSGPAVSGSSYARHLMETIGSLGAHGQCVIVGRGAAQILPANVTLRVRLVGPMQERVKAVCQKLCIPKDDAKKWIKKTDDERSCFVKDYFRRDASDPRQYDLVLNSARLGVTACAELIIETLHRLQALAQPGSTVQRMPESHQHEQQTMACKAPDTQGSALLSAVPLSASGQPEGNPGCVDVTGIVPQEIHVDPNLTEGHAGYEESGDSEIIPPERMAARQGSR